MSLLSSGLLVGFVCWDSTSLRQVCGADTCTRL